MNNYQCIICEEEGYQKFSGGWYCKECTEDALDNMAEDKRELEEWYIENGERVGRQLSNKIKDIQQLQGGE